MAYDAHSLREIQAAKDQLPKHQETLAELRSHIAEIETHLSRICPQRVIVCAVPGYTDPPERVAAAERDRKAGIVSILTPEHGEMIARGEMKPPDHTQFVQYSQVYAMKRHVVQLATLIQQAASSQVDAQALAATKMA